MLSKLLPISAVSCILCILVIISLPPPVSEARIEDAGRKGLQEENIYCHLPLNSGRILHIILG